LVRRATLCVCNRTLSQPGAGPRFFIGRPLA
jgi:hypothetical protein